MTTNPTDGPGNGESRNAGLTDDPLDQALKRQLKAQLLNLISVNGCETFAEIQNHNIKGFQGEYVFTWERRPDLVLWPNLSKEAIAAFTELLVEKRIFPHPAHLLTYAYDGMMVSLPVAKRPRTRHQKPRWLPIIFRTRPI